MASLDEFAQGRRQTARRAWWYSLPEDVRAEIVDSSAPSEVVVVWLREELGLTDASFGKVDPFRRKARHERQAKPD
jgi:hypothetical protein